LLISAGLITNNVHKPTRRTINARSQSLEDDLGQEKLDWKSTPTENGTNDWKWRQQVKDMRFYLGGTSPQPRDVIAPEDLIQNGINFNFYFDLIKLISL